VHFLVLGLGLFVLFDLVASDEAAYDSKVINVDRDALLTFVQYRLRAFQPKAAAARLDGMSEAELERLISDYVREEALHREALALGMDKNDYIIKRRLIQSIEFITDDLASVAVEVADEDVQAYFDANREDYYVDPFVTFTHVFFNNERHGREVSLALATAKLAELNGQRVPFSNATRHGDRFPYFVNYVERGPQFVISHFGAPMAEAVFALAPSTGRSNRNTAHTLYCWRARPRAVIRNWGKSKPAFATLSNARRSRRRKTKPSSGLSMPMRFAAATNVNSLDWRDEGAPVCRIVLRARGGDGAGARCAAELCASHGDRAQHI